MNCYSGDKVTVKAIYRILYLNEINIIVYLLTCLIFFAFSSTALAQDEINQNILILHSYHKGQNWNDKIANGIESVFNDNRQKVELFFEYMDTKRFYDDHHLENLYQLLKYKYRDQTLDVIISSDDHAFNFLLKKSDIFFPEIPKIFCGVNRLNKSSIDSKKLFTGVVESTDLDKTIEIALQLHPKTKNIFVLVDKTVSGMAHRRQIKDIISHFSETITFDLLDNVELSSIENQLQELPENSIVLWMNLYSDVYRNPITIDDVSNLLKDYCNVPTYSLWGNRLGKEIIGGKLISGYAQGKTAALMAQKILQGEKIEDIQIIYKSPNPYKFDYKQMSQFGIEISDLPTESIVINQPFSFYNENKRLVWIVTACMIGLVAIIIILIFNIFYRKVAENALKESRERMELALKGADLGMWDYTIKIKDWNFDERSIQMLGANPKSDAEFNALLHPDDIKKYHDIWNELEEDRKPFYVSEYRVKMPSGQYKWLKDKGKIVERDSNGKPVRIAGTVQNITVRKQTEEEKTKLVTQLHQVQKMESIGTLAGGIAHDFNNILFPIIGHSEMLIEDAPDGSPLRDGLNQIYTSALRAKDMIKQILTFSRQEIAELKLMKMQPIIKEALKLIRSTIPTTIEIKQDIQTDCGAIKADPTQIHQIIMNLATNAYHAMEETAGELNVRLKEVEFGELDLFTPDIKLPKYVLLSISDTGKGMDKDTIKKIYDPFFTTKETGKGTGMGLSVVHGIVKSMSGTIKVDSRPEKGTEFQIYLPLAEAVKEEQSTHVETSIQGGTEHILLVDDEDVIATVVKQMLERLGYQVTSRTSSIEALEAFRASSYKFDIVITDMQMPNMSGDKLASELTKIRPDIPVLLCTGFSETMSEVKAASLGINGFLLKPIVMKDLSHKIREVLDKK